jgi:hypothetical protein
VGIEDLAEVEEGEVKARVERTGAAVAAGAAKAPAGGLRLSSMGSYER